MDATDGHDRPENVLPTPTTQPAALAESRIIAPTRCSPLERLPEPALRRIVGVQSRRPFSPWESVQRRVPEHLEVRRFERIPEERRAKSWNRRRAHAPHDRLVPPEWDMDVLYFRFQEEEEYAGRLKDLQPGVVTRLSTDLLCLNTPWVPFCWPALQTPCMENFRNFTPVGDLRDPEGGDIDLDSAWRLRLQSMSNGTGDPGRLIAETKKEYRDSTRKSYSLVPFQQVEFYEQNSAARNELYPKRPHWWTECWLSQNMVVPLPPVTTYRARFLLEECRGTLEYEFWWRVFETEWTAIAFGRWCSDIVQRTIMWALPSQLRANIAEIGVEALLQGSPYKVADVRGWLCAHDRHGWALSTQQYRVRGPTENSPELIELLTEFVRPFSNPSNLHLRHVPVSAPMSTPTSEQDPKGKAAQPTGIREPPSSQSPAVPRYPAGLRSVPGPANLDDEEEEVVVASGVVSHARAARDPPYPSVYSRGSDRRYDISYYDLPLEVSKSLRSRLDVMGLTDIILHFSRHLLPPERASSGHPPIITEDALAFAFDAVDQRRGSLQGERDSLSAALEREKERNELLERRLRGSEMRVDVLTEALLESRGPIFKKRRMEE
jgi:hypothetical protein